MILAWDLRGPQRGDASGLGSISVPCWSNTSLLRSMTVDCPHGVSGVVQGECRHGVVQGWGWRGKIMKRTFLAAIEWMFVPPLAPVQMLKPDLQCNGIWRQGLWEVSRLQCDHAGGAPHDAISALRRKGRDQSLLPPMWGHSKKGAVRSSHHTLNLQVPLWTSSL